MQHRMSARGLLDLPREVIRNIALHIYDPLELTQQDRLSEPSPFDLWAVSLLTNSMGHLFHCRHARRTAGRASFADCARKYLPKDS